MKLYRVTIRGMSSVHSGQVNRQISYVVADTAEAAYNTVRKFLDEKDLGLTWERELDKIELLAEEKDYTNTGHMLFRAQQTKWIYDPSSCMGGLIEPTPGVEINFPDLPPAPSSGPEPATAVPSKTSVLP